MNTHILFRDVFACFLALLISTVFLLPTMAVSAEEESGFAAEVYDGAILICQTEDFESAWLRAKELSGTYGREHTITVRMLGDLIATNGSFSSSVSVNGAISVSENMNLELDLNGHIVSRDLKKPQRNGNLFTVYPGATLTISDSDPLAEHYGYGVRGGILTGGSSDEIGGCIDIRATGTLIMNGCSVCSCYTNERGAAIRMREGGSIILNGTGFFYNADNHNGGGAIYCENGTLSMTDTVFEGNYSTNHGGAVRLQNCELSAYNCIFRSNKTKQCGGSIWLDGSGSRVKIDGCTFTGCRADDDGGAAYVNNCQYVYLMNSIFSQNSAGDQSGAIHIDCDHVVLDSTTVIGNTARNKGGAIFVNDLNDLGVQGRTIVRDNHLENGRDDNIVLEWTTAFSKAFINNGGLYEGSEIHLHSDTSGTTKVANNISIAQAQYFFADNGTMKQDSMVNKQEKFASSVIGEGNILAVMIGLMLSIIIVTLLVLYKKHTERRKEEE